MTFEVQIDYLVHAAPAVVSRIASASCSCVELFATRSEIHPSSLVLIRGY